MIKPIEDLAAELQTTRTINKELYKELRGRLRSLARVLRIEVSVPLGDSEGIFLWVKDTGYKENATVKIASAWNARVGPLPNYCNPYPTISNENVVADEDLVYEIVKATPAFLNVIKKRISERLTNSLNQQLLLVESNCQCKSLED